jgi:hypothetical protein
MSRVELDGVIERINKLEKDSKDVEPLFSMIDRIGVLINDYTKAFSAKPSVADLLIGERAYDVAKAYIDFLKEKEAENQKQKNEVEQVAKQSRKKAANRQEQAKAKHATSRITAAPDESTSPGEGA